VIHPSARPLATGCSILALSVALSLPAPRAAAQTFNAPDCTGPANGPFVCAGSTGDKQQIEQGPALDVTLTETFDQDLDSVFLPGLNLTSDLSVTVTGDAGSRIQTEGDHGIRARGPAIDVTMNGSVNARSFRTIPAADPTTGNAIDLEGEGPITVRTGAGAITGSDRGIRAEVEASSATAIAPISITTGSGAVTGGTDGIDARILAGGPSAISITTNGDVTGASDGGGVGIYAENRTGGGIVVEANAAVGGEFYGIVARDRNSGDISITANGDASGERSSISARTYGDIDVTTAAGTVMTGKIVARSGDDPRGFYVEDVTITVGGSVAAARAGDAAIEVGNTSSGATTVTTEGAVTGETYGIQARSYYGSVTITTRGDVSGGSYDDDADTYYYAAIVVDGGLGDVDIAFTGDVTALGDASSITVDTEARRGDAAGDISISTTPRDGAPRAGRITVFGGIDAARYGSVGPGGVSNVGDVLISLDGVDMQHDSPFGVFAYNVEGAIRIDTGDATITSLRDFGRDRREGGAGAIQAITNRDGEITITVGRGGEGEVIGVGRGIVAGSFSYGNGLEPTRWSPPDIDILVDGLLEATPGSELDQGVFRQFSVSAADVAEAYGTAIEMRAEYEFVDRYEGGIGLGGFDPNQPIDQRYETGAGESVRLVTVAPGGVVNGDIVSFDTRVEISGSQGVIWPVDDLAQTTAGPIDRGYDGENGVPVFVGPPGYPGYPGPTLGSVEYYGEDTTVVVAGVVNGDVLFGSGADTFELVSGGLVNGLIDGDAPMAMGGMVAVPVNGAYPNGAAGVAAQVSDAYTSDNGSVTDGSYVTDDRYGDEFGYFALGGEDLFVFSGDDTDMVFEADLGGFDFSHLTPGEPVEVSDPAAPMQVRNFEGLLQDSGTWRYRGSMQDIVDMDVEGGIALFDGSFNGMDVVGLEGTTIGGNGVIGALATEGTLVPVIAGMTTRDLAPGALVVRGGTLLARGARFGVVIDGQGGASRLQAEGGLEIDPGVTVDVIQAPADATTLRPRYRIVDASGIDGRFEDEVADDLPDIAFQLDQRAETVDLILVADTGTPEEPPVETGGETPPEETPAEEGAPPAPTAPPAPVGGIQGDVSPKEIFAAVNLATSEMTRESVMNALKLINAFQAGALTTQSTRGMAGMGGMGGAVSFGFGEVFGLREDVDPEGARPGFESEGAGFLGGVGGRTDDGVGWGVALFGGNQDVTTTGGTADVDTVGAAIFASTELSGWTVDSAFAYASTDTDFTRAVAPGVTALGAADGSVALASVTGSYDLAPTAGGVTFSPYLGLDAMRIETDDFVETGAGIFNLAVRGDDLSLGFVRAGVDAQFAPRTLGDGGVLSTSGRLGLEQAFGDTDPTSVSSLAALPGGLFTAPTAGLDDTRLTVGLGVNYQRGGVSVSLGYDGAIGDRSESHRAGLGVRVEF
jgi:hypothetical protein